MRYFLTILFLCGFGLAQGVPLTGIALSPTGQPVPDAPVRICSGTATGTPCSPTVGLFADSGLTIPVSNPLPNCATVGQQGCVDVLGNFMAWAASANLFEIQITNPVGGAVYSYYQTAGNPGAQGLTGPTGPPGSGSYLPGSIIDPYIDGRSQGINCDGTPTTAAAFANWILSTGTNRKEVPANCKLNLPVLASSAMIHGLEGLPGGIDIYGGEGSEIFFCGTGGTGFGLEFSRSGYFHFHGFRIQPTDYTYCPGGSDVLVPLAWTNNRAGGSTSTRAEFDHLKINSTGAPHGGYTAYPTSGGWGYTADDGNQVALLDTNPPWSNLGIHQDSSTAIVNGTNYSVTFRILGDNCCAVNYTGAYSVHVALTGCTSACNSYSLLNATLGAYAGSFTELAPANCAPTLHSWSSCTVNYTGTALTAGQFIGVSILNSQAVPNGFTLSRVAVDHIQTTNFSLNNPSFESLPGSLTITAGNFVNPAIWQWFYVQNTGPYPQFKGFQVGVPGDQNLEDGSFHDSDIDAFMGPASYGWFAPYAANGEGWKAWRVNLNNMWRGYYGALGGYLALRGNGTGTEGPNLSTFTVFGQPDGAMINIAGCAASVLVLEHPNWDGSGPILNGYLGGAIVGGCPDVTLIAPEIFGPYTEAGAYDFDVSSLGTVRFLGGYPSNISAAALNNPDNAFIGKRSGGTVNVVGTDTISMGNSSLSHGEKLLAASGLVTPAAFSLQRINVPCFKKDSASTGTTLDCLTRFDNPVVLTRILFQTAGSAPSGCSTQPHFGVAFLGGAIASDLTLTNGNTNADSGAISINLNANTDYTIGQTVADAGCTTHAGPGTITIEYKMQ